VDRRLSGKDSDMGVAAHALRRTARTRNAFMILVGTEMLLAGGRTFERTGTQIHASKALEASLFWAQSRFVEVLEACDEDDIPVDTIVSLPYDYSMTHKSRAAV
jgi:hypothetical protein